MRHLYKLSIVIVSALLVGCASTSIVSHSVDVPVLERVESKSIVLDTQELFLHSNLGMSSSAVEPVIKKVEITGSKMSPESTKSFIPTTKKVVKVFKAVKNALADEPPVPAPGTTPTVTPMAPGPAPRPAQTGAKLQVLGIDLEFWVGNDDNWSTVWKLIVLVLFVYGGLRLINLFISRSEKVLAI